MAIFGIECLLLRVLFLSDLSWVIPVSAFVVAWFFYIFAISSAYNWAALFKAAFDLFRYQLADALGLKPTPSLGQERDLWIGLTRFWQRTETFDGFNHSEQSWPVRPSKS
jgi:hypothetical protein